MLAVRPSNLFNSAVVAVTPSMMFNSAVLAVTPSMMFNSSAVAVRPSNLFNSSAVTVSCVSLIVKASQDTLAASRFATSVPVVKVKLPVVLASSGVVPSVNLSNDSFHPINALLTSEPLLIIIPESYKSSVSPSFNSINLSLTVVFVVLTEVTLPFTVKLPDTDNIPSTITLLFTFNSPFIIVLSPKVVSPTTFTLS